MDIAKVYDGARLSAEYGPLTTLFNRFHRWSEKGIWQGLLAALVVWDDPPDFAMVDSTTVCAAAARPKSVQLRVVSCLVVRLRFAGLMVPSPA